MRQNLALLLILCVPACVGAAYHAAAFLVVDKIPRNYDELTIDYVRSSDLKEPELRRVARAWFRIYLPALITLQEGDDTGRGVLHSLARDLPRHLSESNSLGPFTERLRSDPTRLAIYRSWAETGSATEMFDRESLDNVFAARWDSIDVYDPGELGSLIASYMEGLTGVGTELTVETSYAMTDDHIELRSLSGRYSDVLKQDGSKRGVDYEFAAEDSEVPIGDALDKISLPIEQTLVARTARFEKSEGTCPLRLEIAATSGNVEFLWTGRILFEGTAIAEFRASKRKSER